MITPLFFQPRFRIVTVGFLKARRLVSTGRFTYPASPRPPRTLSDREAAALRKELSSDDAQIGYRAMWGLAAAPKNVLPLLRRQLRPVAIMEAKQIKQWLADLDHDDFATRRRAETGLAQLDEAVEREMVSDHIYPLKYG